MNESRSLGGLALFLLFCLTVSTCSISSDLERIADKLAGPEKPAVKIRVER